MSGSSAIPALLPTNGIEDPAVRAFLDRLKVAWNAATTGSDRFISSRDFNRLASEAAARLLTGDGGTGFGNGANDPFKDLSDAIRTSVLYQLLDSGISTADIQAVRNSVDTALAGVTQEQTVRFSQDSVLASAVNRIWGYIGGSTAVITDGALAAANPSSAVATRWNSVISAVTDPNTGLVSSASILQETRTYANNTDSTLNALYSVRAQITSGGQTVVGGFGLAATSGAGSPQGPTIDFGVLANKFWIGAPSSGYDPAAEYSVNNQFPFIVVTTPTTINGVTYTAGVYMKRATIGFAAIGSAQIADAAITNAKIGNSIQSDNYVQGVSGWKIGKTLLYNQVLGGVSYPVMAEFNGIVVSRPTIVATGVYAPSGATFTFDPGTGGGGGKDGATGGIGGWSPNQLVLFFDTGYADFTDVYTVTRPAFQGKAVCVASFATFSSSPGGAKFYDVLVEAEPVSSVDHYAVGASGAIPGGRIIMKLTIPVPRNIHPAITGIQITQINWSLLRVT